MSHPTSVLCRIPGRIVIVLVATRVTCKLSIAHFLALCDSGYPCRTQPVYDKGCSVIVLVDPCMFFVMCCIAHRNEMLMFSICMCIVVIYQFVVQYLDVPMKHCTALIVLNSCLLWICVQLTHSYSVKTCPNSDVCGV